MEYYTERKNQLLSLGFKLDNDEPFPTWNHFNETWICDFALEQYDKTEWEKFIKAFNDYELL